MDGSTPDSSVLHYLPEFAQTHVHWVGDPIQLSHPLSPPSPPALATYIEDTLKCQLSEAFIDCTNKTVLRTSQLQQ